MRRKLSPSAPRDLRYHRYVNFHIDEPWGPYLGYVARGTGLYPIIGKPVDRGDTAICAGIRRLVHRYRDVLDKLREAGHVSLVASHSLGNCRPAFVRTRPATRFCNMVNLCPHCWTRRAVHFWSRMDAALFPVREGNRAEVAMHDLIQVVRRFAPIDLAPYVPTKAPLAAVIAERLARVPVPGPQVFGSRSREARQLRDRFTISWGVEALIVDFDHDSKPSGWQLDIRQLYAVPPGGPFEPHAGKMTRLETPSRMEVVRAASRLGAYPRGLLMGPGDPPALLPPALINRYHDTVLGRQLWSSFGDLPARFDPDGEGPSAAECPTLDELANRAGGGPADPV